MASSWARQHGCNTVASLELRIFCLRVNRMLLSSCVCPGFVASSHWLVISAWLMWQNASWESMGTGAVIYCLNLISRVVLRWIRQTTTAGCPAGPSKRLSRRPRKASASKTCRPSASSRSATFSRQPRINFPVWHEQTFVCLPLCFAWEIIVAKRGDWILRLDDFNFARRTKKRLHKIISLWWDFK